MDLSCFSIIRHLKKHRIGPTSMSNVPENRIQLLTGTGDLVRATDVAMEVVLVAQLSLRECITSSRAKTSEFQSWRFGLLVTADSLGVWSFEVSEGYWGIA